MSLDRTATFPGPLSGTLAGSLDLGRGLFLASSLIAPIEILLVGSFTLYDLLTTALFVLLVARGRIPLAPPGILVSGAVFLIFALLSTMRAPHPEESLTQVLQYVFILVVQVPVILVYARSRFMIRASLVAFLLGAIGGIVASYLFPHESWAGRMGALFAESPNRLGYPVAFVSPFVCQFLLARWRSGKGRALTILGGAVAAYFMLWALGASGSRSAAAGTLVGLTIFLSLRRGFSLRPAGLVRLTAAGLIVAMCAALLYHSSYFPATLRERIDRTLSAESSLVHDREILAVAGWRAFRESPFLGVGLDNFRYVVDRYAPTSTLQLPHNLWIQLLAHTGLFGTLGFLGMIACWFWILLRAQWAERAEGHRELLWAFIASMSAVLTIFLFVPVLIQRQYWWIFALGLSAARPWEPNGRQAMSVFSDKEAHS